MYSYQSSITKEYILRMYKQEDIFKYILKEEILLKKKCYHAPYRDDIHGTCFLQYSGTVLYFLDFANDTKTHFNCFELWAKVYKMKESDVYIDITKHIEISKEKNPLVKEQCNNNVKVSNNATKKFHSQIAIVKQPFTKRDLEYWAKFGITKKQLMEDNVVSVKYVRVVNNDIDITYEPKTLCYAYTEWGNCLKIYQPLAKKERKWLTNCKPNSIGGTHTIPNQTNIDETLIITKSYKDWRVLVNAHCYAIWLQNEVTLPELELLTEFTHRFKDIVIIYDNDDIGIQNANKLQEYLQCDNCRTVFIPFKTLKDPAELYSSKGDDKLVEFLNNNNIIRICKRKE
jgi:hypothetical protein